jgi:uncharacterized protein (DUF885 family)
MKYFLWLLVAVAGCARLEPARAPAPADAQFHGLANEYLAGYLAWRPQTGTALGLHQYDGQVTDFSQASIEAELNRLKSFEQRLASLDTKALSRPAYFDYRLLLAAIRRERFGFEDMQVYSRNPMTYAGALDVNIYIKRDFAPLPERVLSLTKVLEQAPALFAAARSNLASTLPRPFVETAIQQANGSADFLATDLPAAIKEIPAGELRTRFEAADHRAIAELKSFARYLTEQKLPQSDSAFALGRDEYVKLLSTGEMLDISPERILEIGMKELRRQQASFAQAARIIDPTRTPTQVFANIQQEHPTETNLIPETARGLEAIRQFVVDHRIIALPSAVRAQVEPTPQYARATSFASMDTPGPFEKKATEAYYYVTPPEADWTSKQKQEWLTAFNYYDIAVTSIHEAYPGHYVQFLCLNASPATRLEKIFTSYAFTEGWAHYCEQMMLDEGFPTRAGSEQVREAKYRLAQADEALLRLCRLCVSIKMHCQGMSLDDATRFFEQNCYYQPEPAREEAVRGTFDPEYLYYTVGKLEIMKLRDDYRHQQGTSFSLEQFHNQLLRHGGPPIRLLRELFLKDPAQWDQTL